MRFPFYHPKQKEDQVQESESGTQETKTSDVFITSDVTQAIAHQISEQGTRLFKINIAGESKYVVAKTQHRALLGAAAEFMKIEAIPERTRFKMLESAFPELARRADGTTQKQLFTEGE